MEATLCHHHSYLAPASHPVRLQEPADPFFCIHLPDYSKPAFCTFTKRYFGTMKEINSFLDSLMTEERKCIGKLSFHPVPVLGTRSSVLSDFAFNHENIWGATYKIHCDLLKSVHVWVKCEDRFFRCMKTAATNLQFCSEFDPNLRPIKKMFWGFPHVIECEDPVTFNQLYVIEKEFSSQFDAELDMRKFSSDVNLSGFLDDIFGDG